LNAAYKKAYKHIHGIFMKKDLIRHGIVYLLIGGGTHALVMAADCPDRFETTSLDYLGRNPENTKSYWLTQSNRADSFRLSAPGVGVIDSWQTSSSSTHLSESDVVKNDANGTHKLDRMKPDGSFDCFLQSRNQNNPLLPPTWRPPAIPDRPIVIRPEIPDRPIVIRPEIPDRPIVVRPEIPDRPIVIRPEIPEPPIVTRPKPERPIQIGVKGRSVELAYAHVLQLCPSVKIAADGEIDPDDLASCVALAEALEQAPLTLGRDLLDASLWNAWADVQYMRSENRRGFSPIESRSATLSVGADRLVQPDFSLGLMLSLSDQRSESFAGNIQSEGDNVLAGPYFAYGLTPNWSLFGNALFGQVDRHYQLLSLTGHSTPLKYSASLNVQGEYALNPNSVIRPKLGINYDYERGENYQLNGRILGRQLIIDVDSHSHKSGQMQASAELNTRLKNQNGQLFVPYLESGVFYNYLDQGASSRWQGMARAGLRTVASESLLIDLSASYQSIGVSNLDVWDCKLFIAYSF
jgi:hypothetical protein